MSMAGYTKLFNSILASTIWEEDDKTRIVWITLLAMADKFGVADGSVPGIATLARVTQADCQKALAKLQAPDKDSRSDEYEGRRIRKIDGGWLILNHEKYRAKIDDDERREYLRVKKAESRRRLAAGVNASQQPSKKSTQAEAEPDPDPETTQKKKEREERAPSAPRRSLSPSTNPDLSERAAAFLERYQALYVKHRNGAHYHSRPIDFQHALELCRTWPDDARLDKIAIVFLTTDHKFAEEGSRTVGQMAGLASWCDGRLAEAGIA